MKNQGFFLSLTTLTLLVSSLTTAENPSLPCFNTDSLEVWRSRLPHAASRHCGARPAGETLRTEG